MLAPSAVLPPRAEGLSRVEQILEVAESTDIQNALSPEEMTRLPFVWDFWARPEQQAPYHCEDLGCGCEGDWLFWLVLAGRGFGKTRTCAEWFRQVAPQQGLVNLVGPTLDDVAAIMLEGESGLFECCSNDERPVWKKQQRKLVWPNGAVSRIFTADEPDRLRGKQHRGGWLEEIASWRYGEEAIDQFKLGLRLPGRNGWQPRAVIATTPKPHKWLKALIAEEDEETGRKVCHITRGTTYANRANLAPKFFTTVIRKFEGSRMGRQELLGHILGDAKGALWKREWIDANRVRVAPVTGWKRVVVSVDPAVSHGDDSDDTGITVVAEDWNGWFYVLADLTMHAGVEDWTAMVINAAAYHGADMIVAEKNNGGDLVSAAILTAAVAWRKKNPGRTVAPVKLVHASRGKRTRAEPVALLYEQGRVHHIGSHPELEDQLCDWVPTKPGDSPDRLDAVVWGLHELSAASTIAHEQPAPMPTVWKDDEEMQGP